MLQLALLGLLNFFHTSTMQLREKSLYQLIYFRDTIWLELKLQA